MHNYCTLFDRNYLYKGLALYFSMIKHCSDFKLWILCLDDTTYQLLTKMSIKNVALIPLQEFENDNLKRVKKERNVAEYSWTCTSNFCRYLLENKDIESLAYLDADLYFFDNPEPLFAEIANNSIAIIEHRFPKGQESLEKRVGKFNVGFVYFKNDTEGKKVANWWANKTIEWCFDRIEDGRYGDQMYLDDWETRFSNVKVIKNERVGSAPWNIKEAPLQIPIFYHFHAFKIESPNNFIEASGYFIPRAQRQLFYQPYKKEISRIIKFVSNYDPSFHFGFSKLKAKDKFWYLVYNKIVPEKIIFGLTKIKHRFYAKVS